ncbi:MAG: hypothetical protein U9N85_01095, partial [Bacteroidota bacterium]|nr:hypothetical protein [Bacteroidota bacterium]
FEAPVFYEAFTINTIDQDNDNYLEQWDFELDIDAPYTGIAENVYIDISDNEGNDWGTYGPYTFEGETSDDNISISSWYMTDYNFEAPQNVQFTFYAYNNRGNDNEYMSVPVDGNSTDASLSDLQVDNSTIPGFNYNTLYYTYDLPYGSTIVPTVSAVTNHQAATLQITQATNLSGSTAQRTATVLVTAEDGTTELSYSVIFNVLPPNDDATLNNLTVSGSTIAGFNS